jgi:C_GCAxxG_C_C family probable redox protein
MSASDLPKDRRNKRIEGAVACFNEGFSCSQALLSTYGPLFGLDRDLAFKVSGGFGAGMGRMGSTCGAVTGALMVLGLKYGRTAAGDRETKEKVYGLVREFIARFKARNDSIICNELLECDISTPEGMKRANELKLVSTRCPTFVRDAAELLEELLAGGGQ